MTRERAKELAPIIAAYGDGREVQIAYEFERWGTFIGQAGFDFENASYRIKPEPRTRPMTRGEALYMVTTTPAMVIKHPSWGDVYPSHVLFATSFKDCEYAIIDKHGDPIDGWHKFEVVE